MKVVVTGSAGQVGQRLANAGAPQLALFPFNRAELDITDTDAVRRICGELRPDVIVNCAAYTAVDAAEKNSSVAETINVTGVRNLLTAADEFDARVIHISTDYVFNGRQVSPYSIDDMPNPMGVYGKTKLAGERLLLDSPTARHTVIRTSWVYSASPGNFLTKMIELLNARDEVGVVADQFGRPTSADSLAKAILMFVEHPNMTGLYHWTDAGSASWFDFAKVIELFGRRHGLVPEHALIVPVSTDAFPTLAKRPVNSILCSQDAWQQLGYIPRHWIEQVELCLLKLKQAVD